MKTYTQFLENKENHYLGIGNDGREIKLPEIQSNGEWEINDLGLTKILEIPYGVKYLICSDNVLESLPSLPPNLYDLYCDNNQIGQLPPLPASLEVLHCDDNVIRELPKLPTSLIVLSAKNNYLQEITQDLNQLNECNLLGNDFELPLEIELIKDLAFHQTEKFNEIYDEHMQKKFGNPAFQIQYLKENPHKWRNLEPFGIAPKTQRMFPQIFKVKRTGII